MLLVRTLVLFAGLLSVALAEAPPDKAKAATPKAVVAEFCKLDFDGNLTSSEGFHKMENLFTWPDAPGWDGFTVVRNYQVISEKIAGGKATVEVEYEVLGSLDSSPSFHAAKATEKAHFRLVHTFKKHVMSGSGNEKVISTPLAWRIEQPQNDPHISYQYAVEILKGWGNSDDAQQKADSPSVLQELEAAAAH